MFTNTGAMISEEEINKRRNKFRSTNLFDSEFEELDNDN